MEEDRLSSEHRNRWTMWIAGGIVLLLVASVWLSQRTTPSLALAEPGAFVLPPMAGGGDLSRFRRDAWFLPDEDNLGFVEIPAGPFLMGSDPRVDPLAFDNERWVQTGGGALVELPTYYIGRYPVTVAQFRAFVEATGHRADAAALRPPADHPVTMISWPDAVAYGRWLERTLAEWSGTPPDLARRIDEGWRITLPTEAEWEKAARGTDGRIFPWGDEPRRDRANFLSRGTAPVGSFPCPECPYGVRDMAGNVWELTRTPYRATPYDRTEDPQTVPDLSANALWVMRGGSYDDPERTIRTATRGGVDPGARRAFIGFRLVLTPPESP